MYKEIIISFQALHCLLSTGLKSQNQELSYNMATMVTIYCPMRFEKYPLDQQSCPLQIGSYGYNDSYMSYKLGRLTRDTQQRIAVLDYRIDIFNLSSEYLLMKGLEDPNSNFTLTGFMMELNRKRFSYVVNFYLPSGLFVVVSWVSLIRYVDIEINTNPIDCVL